jgi:CHAD domain-containing protein
MKPASKLLLDQPTHIALARVVGNYLDAAYRGLERLEKPFDPKELHAFRVSIRRLRSLLHAYRPWLGRVAGPKPRRRLRELTQTTNAVRDADVAIDRLLSLRDKLARDERAGFDWFLRRLQTRRRRGYTSAARKKLGSDFVSIAQLIRNRIDRIDEPEQRPFRTTFLDLLEPEVTGFREQLAAITGASDERIIHRSRIQSKRLRYLIEPLHKEFAEARALIRPLRHLQSLLGELHDMQVLEEEIGRGIEKAAKEKARRLHRLAVDGAVSALARERSRDEILGLLALASRSRERSKQLYARFEREWLTNRQFELREEIGALRAAIGRA